MIKIMPMVGLALLAACTTPADVSQPLTAGGDKNAKFDIRDTANGFTVDLRYSRYQFVPEADALLVACRSIATTRAYTGDQQAYVEPSDKGWLTIGIAETSQEICRHVFADAVPDEPSD